MVTSAEAKPSGRPYRPVAFAVFGLILALAVTASCTISREGVHPDLAPGIAVAELRIDNMNSWLIHRRSDPSTAILIDTGLTGNEGKLVARIRDAGVDPAEIDAIILTHGHYDHIGGARRLREMFEIPVIIGLGDRRIAEGADAPVCPTVPYARLLAGEPIPSKHWALTPDVTISESVPVSRFSDLPGEITPMPGHTEGSLVIRIGNGVFVGDTIRGKIFGRGPARHFFMCDLEDNNADIARIAGDIAADASFIYPGHLSSFSMEALRIWLDKQ